jgi:hypothetical protein
LAVGQALVEFVDGLDDLRQRRPFATELLSVVRIAPDARVFQLA